MSKMAADETHGGNTLRKIVDYFSHLAVVPTYYEFIKNNDTNFAATPYLSKLASKSLVASSLTFGMSEPYYISYGSVRATAYCIQPAKPGPGSGIYTITKLADNQALAKVCYYGTDAAGAESYFANKHRDFSSGKRFILVHMAAAYAYGSSDAFYGTNATGQELAMDIYNYCVKKSEIPDVSMSFSDANVKAYVEGNTQRTKEII